MTDGLVEELLSRVASANNSRSQLTKHLIAHRDVLTAGGSRMPKVVGEFLYAAIDAGIQGLVCPACARCHRPKTLLHLHGDGERICERCYKDLHTATCSACGREKMRVHARTATGEPMCARCHGHTRPAGECAGCGRHLLVKTSQADGLGYCRGCQAARAPRESCTGCGRSRLVNARTDDGEALCGTCYQQRRASNDTCDECGIIGPLITRADGRGKAPKNLCARCYRHPRRTCGICGRIKRVALKATATTTDVCPTCYQAPVIECSICHQQALGRRTTNNGQPRCFSCQSAAQIDAALTGPDGIIRPELQPVRDTLTASDKPLSLLTNWHRLASLHLLADIAQGRLDLTHEALDERAQVFSVTYLRAVLVATGALPDRDEYIARLHLYLHEVIAGVHDPGQRAVLTRYARWHVISRVKTNRHGQLSSATAYRCRADIQAAKTFLDHLNDHHHDLHDCPQSCLDEWILHGNTLKLGFIRWLIRHEYLPRTRLPRPVPRKDPGHDIDPIQQLNLARRLLHDPESASVEDRAASCLLLLYAQPVAKIVALTTNDIRTRDDDTYLMLGPEPLLLIPPLDALLTALPAVKPFGTASMLADRRWLFTGKNAGTHLHPASLIRRIQRLGITSRASRNTALLHLASTTPPAVFADLIGVDISTATHWTQLAGAAWNNYPPLAR